MHEPNAEPRCTKHGCFLTSGLCLECRPEVEGEIPIAVETLVSGHPDRRGEPFVRLLVGDSATQLDPPKAREVAMMLVECAAAAEQDSLLVDFVEGRIGADPGTAAALLHDFRELRASRDVARKDQTGA